MSLSLLSCELLLRIWEEAMRDADAEHALRYGLKAPRPMPLVCRQFRAAWRRGRVLCMGPGDEALLERGARVFVMGRPDSLGASLSAAKDAGASVFGVAVLAAPGRFGGSSCRRSRHFRWW
jgi:hypothetical protein